MFIASSTLVYNQKCKELSFGICGYPVYRKNKLVIRVILQADFTACSTAYYDAAITTFTGRASNLLPNTSQSNPPLTIMLSR